MEFPQEYFKGEVRSDFYVQPLMKRVWAAQLEILSEIDRICIEHNLKYIAWYGTLLGAIRHKGFVPWDDDMDIAMPREDYERFVYYAKRELPEEWHVYGCNAEEFDTLLVRVSNTSRIRLDSSFLEQFHGCPFAVGIDIFPLDYIPDDLEEERNMIYLLGLLDMAAVQWDEHERISESSETMLKELEQITGQVFNRTKPLKSQLFYLADRVSAMYWDEKTEKMAVATKLGDNSESKFPVCWLEKIIRVPFENTTIPIIEDYDFLLKKYYGEAYMEPSIVYAVHDYPFFKKQYYQLEEFFKENNVVKPECFHTFLEKSGRPLISVIIPCHNVEKYIDRCLTSLMRQTISLTNLEIICIDAASEDGTRNKLKAWEKKLNDIMIVIQCETDVAPGEMQITGIRYASADHVAFVDAKDWLEMDCLEKMYRALQIADFDVVACSCQKDYSDTLTYFSNRGKEENNKYLVINSAEKRTIFFDSHLLGADIWGKMVRRGLLAGTSDYLSEQDVCEDKYIMAFLYLYVINVYLMEEKLYHEYRGNDERC